MEIIFKNFILDPLLSVLYFPIWWYSKGFFRFFNFLKKIFKEVTCPFVLKILVKNLFKPMYGDYSREGRIISFFMRLINISFRIFKIVIVFILFFALLLAYLFLLPLVFYQIICNFNNSCRYFFWSPII